MNDSSTVSITEEIEKVEGARSGIQALDAALLVLQALAAHPGAVSLTDLARVTEMPPSKVHRYLASFIKAGLVKQTQRSGRYDLGKGAAVLGLAAIARMDVIERAAECLEDLVEEIGAAGVISVWGPHGATVVRWCRGDSMQVTSFGLGTTLPLLNTASGRVFLAFSPRSVTADLLRVEVERARSLGLRWPDLDPRQDSDIDAVAARVAAAGYASVDGTLFPGLNAISAPVLNWQHEAEAALTLVTGNPRILAPEGAAVRRLLEVAGDICPQLPSLPNIQASDGNQDP